MCGIGLHDLEHDLRRQRDADGTALVHLHHHLHAVLQEVRPLADEIAFQLDLVVGVHVHEGQHVAAGVKVLEIAPLELHLFDHLRGTEALIQLGSVDDVLELDLIVGAAFAGFHALRFHHGPQLAIQFDDHARTDFVACNFSHKPAQIFERARAF